MIRLHVARMADWELQSKVTVAELHSILTTNTVHTSDIPHNHKNTEINPHNCKVYMSTHTQPTLRIIESRHVL